MNIQRLIQLNGKKTHTNNPMKNWAEALNRHFLSKKTYRWPTGTWKKHLTPLINRGIGIKTSIRYHFTPDRMGVLKKTKDNKSWWGCREEKTLVHCKLCSHCGKQYAHPSKNWKIELPWDQAILLLVFIQENRN